MSIETEIKRERDRNYNRTRERERKKAKLFEVYSFGNHGEADAYLIFVAMSALSIQWK